MMLSFMIGPWQLVIVVLLVVILFGGSKKIPELARSLGKAKGEFQKGLKEGAQDDPGTKGDAQA